MRELISMWRYTKMIVLVALTAAIYTAVLLPFKVAVLIPGLTEIRPGAVIPIVTSLLFGPAAAWGSAIGNLVGDILGGMFGLGSIFGFCGNFLLGYVPYKLWNKIPFLSSGAEPTMDKKKQIAEFIFIAILASAICGVIIGYGVDLLGLAPFAALANIIFLNNTLVNVILGPFLVGLLYKRIRSWHLVYSEIMEKEDLRFSSKFSSIGAIAIIVGALGGLIFGTLISVGVYKSAPLSFGFGKGIAGGTGISIGLLPFILLIMLGLSLM